MTSPLDALLDARAAGAGTKAIAARFGLEPVYVGVVFRVARALGDERAAPPKLPGPVRGLAVGQVWVPSGPKARPRRIVRLGPAPAWPHDPICVHYTRPDWDEGRTACLNPTGWRLWRHQSRAVLVGAEDAP